MPTLLDHHISTPHVKIKFGGSKDIKILYGIRFIKSMGSKLVWFFFPLFLYEVANEVSIPILAPFSPIQKGMLLIAFFYGLQRLVILITSIPAARVSTKVGATRAFIFAQLLAILTYVVLQYTAGMYALIILVAVLDGIETNMFWNNYQPLLDVNASKGDVGKDLGFAQFIINFSMMISPAIGGLVIIYFGYQGLFLAGIVVTLIGVLLSLMLEHTYKHRDIPNLKEFISWTKEKSFKRLSLSFTGKYVHEATSVLWPLYVLFLVGSIDKVGFLYTFSLFLAMIVSFFVGMRIDKNHNKKPFYTSGTFLSLFWIARTQIATIWGIALVDTFSRLTGNYHWLFYDRKVMVRGKGKKVFSYFTYREMIVSIAAIGFWTLVALFFLLLPIGWNSLFILAAIGVMLSLLVKEHKA